MFGCGKVNESITSKLAWDEPVDMNVNWWMNVVVDPSDVTNPEPDSVMLLTLQESNVIDIKTWNLII